MSVTEISALPDEVLVYILSLVSPYKDLKHCSLVNKRWRHCALQVARKKRLAFSKAIGDLKLLWSKRPKSDVAEAPANLVISRRYSHSAVYDETDDNPGVFIFGGCTSTSTTFNDLWRLDATTRTWTRPLTTGSYPSPKACATMVKAKEDLLLLFGGWTHPSLYPLHQSWRLFNELHSYDIRLKRWTLVSPQSEMKPPTMAGHSATVHNGIMVVFGGLQKQRSSIGQFSSSCDVWTFNIDSQCWGQEDIPEPRPLPRYGQSQLYLDANRLLILGGCGGPSNIFNDVWLLDMSSAPWRWVECDVRNPEFGAGNMWCHPACKVGNFAVVLGKGRKDASSGHHATERWNVIPQLRKGVNRGYGAIRRPRMQPHEERPDNPDDRPMAVDPVDPAQPGPSNQVFRSSVVLNVNQNEERRRSLPPPEPRMQAFAGPSSSRDPSDPPSAKRKQLETRRRQLDSLRRIEERYKKIEASEQPAAPRDPDSGPHRAHACPCHRLAMYVLDISGAASESPFVEWVSFRSNTSAEAPEEAILYSLVEGRGELVMFGGIQKDVSAAAPARGPASGHTENDSVSNALYFLVPPCHVV